MSDNSKSWIPLPVTVTHFLGISKSASLHFTVITGTSEALRVIFFRSQSALATPILCKPWLVKPECIFVSLQKMLEMS